MAVITYDQLVSQIASRLNRDDLDPDPRGVTVIRDTCVDRVDYYKKECFYSGQVIDDSITMVVGEPRYDYPAGWEELENVQILVGGNWIDLVKVTHEYIDALDVNQVPIQSIPTYWAPFNEQFRVFPAPSDTYSVQLIMNIPPSLPAAGASNFWTGDAKSLVINGVCVEICDAYLHNPILAEKFKPFEQRELIAMQAKTIKARGGIQIKPYL